MQPTRFPRLKPQASEVTQKVLRNLNKRYKNAKKQLAVSSLSDSVFSKERPYAPSGVLPIDQVVSGGLGFPTGIIEVYGGEGSGKTAILESVILACQQSGWHTALYPAEFSINYKRMERLGINTEDLLIFEDAETIEDFFDQLKETVREIRKYDKKTPILVGWDSIASTTTQRSQENKKGLAGTNMGDFAASMSRFFNQLRAFLYKNKVILFAINQTRTNLGQMWGNPETTPGGKALRFYAWVRCRINKIENIENSEDEVIGQICQFETRKNKFYPPFRKCKFHLYWNKGNEGISVPMSVWEYCVDEGVFKKKRGAYRFDRQVVTKRTWPKFYESHKEAIRERIGEN